jgi:predicted nucleotidyltransferase
MDKRATIIDKAREYKKIISDVLPLDIEQCWLFGSYANGCPNEHSDIDIAFVVKHIEDDDYWDGTKILWRLSNDVDYRIEPVLIARDTDYAGFLDEIQRTGVRI